MELPTCDNPVTLVEGEALDLLRALPSASIDSVVTDPPYPCIDREYGRWTEAEWFALMDPVVEECRRVLKPTGSAVFVLQPNSERVGRMRTWLWKFMAKWGDEWGQVQDVWWWNWCALPEAHAIQGRLTRPSLKACVWLGSPNCWRDQNAVLDAPSPRMLSRMRQAEREDLSGRLTYPSGQGMDMARACDAVKKRGGVSPFNVLAMHHGYGQRSAGAHGHGAGTPEKLARWWVRYITPPGGTVLDPFLGSGTTALAALAEGRLCVGSERFPKYAEIARRRIAEAMGTGLLAGIA
jgi:DNA modification methylase